MQNSKCRSCGVKRVSVIWDDGNICGGGGGGCGIYGRGGRPAYRGFAGVAASFVATKFGRSGSYIHVNYVSSIPGYVMHIGVYTPILHTHSCI